MVAAQIAEWQNLEENAAQEKNWLVNEEGVLVLVTTTGPRIVISKYQRPEVLRRVHIDADVRALWTHKVGCTFKFKFFWPGWREELIEHVKTDLRLFKGRIQMRTFEIGWWFVRKLYSMSRKECWPQDRRL